MEVPMRIHHVILVTKIIDLETIFFFRWTRRRMMKVGLKNWFLFNLIKTSFIFLKKIVQDTKWQIHWTKWSIQDVQHKFTFWNYFTNWSKIIISEMVFVLSIYSPTKRLFLLKDYNLPLDSVTRSRLKSICKTLFKGQSITFLWQLTLPK